MAGRLVKRVWVGRTALSIFASHSSRPRFIAPTARAVGLVGFRSRTRTSPRRETPWVLVSSRESSTRRTYTAPEIEEDSM